MSRERLPLPLTTKDFLDPRRAAVVMWDMQNGLAAVRRASQASAIMR